MHRLKFCSFTASRCLQNLFSQTFFFSSSAPWSLITSLFFLPLISPASRQTRKCASLCSHTHCLNEGHTNQDQWSARWIKPICRFSLYQLTSIIFNHSWNTQKVLNFINWFLLKYLFLVRRINYKGVDTWKYYFSQSCFASLSRKFKLSNYLQWKGVNP